MSRLIKEIQVNIPFTMLLDAYLDRFIKYGLNPEIGIDAVALDRCAFSDFKGVADRLRDYLRSESIEPEQRVFPIGYTSAREIVRKAGRKIGIELSPHDLRRHAATYASRAGAPLEIVSKVILRHANLSTTQRYLGTISDIEAIRWIENIYGWRWTPTVGQPDV